MGGHGSKIRDYLIDRKKTTDELLALDVRVVKREGAITTGQEKLIVAEGVEISLAWTPCNFGNSRPWFLCPGEDCGRRVAILYLEGTDLLCRSCHDLTYTSQYENSSLGRARRRAQKARARLGHPEQQLLERPKHMHRKTFLQLGHAYLDAYNEYATSYNEWAAKLRSRYENNPQDVLIQINDLHRETLDAMREELYRLIKELRRESAE